jgi:hypothetical protein
LGHAALPGCGASAETAVQADGSCVTSACSTTGVGESIAESVLALRALQSARDGQAALHDAMQQLFEECEDRARTRLLTAVVAGPRVVGGVLALRTATGPAADHAEAEPAGAGAGSGCKRPRPSEGDEDSGPARKRPRLAVSSSGNRSKMRAAAECKAAAPETESKEAKGDSQPFTVELVWAHNTSSMAIAFAHSGRGVGSARAKAQISRKQATDSKAEAEGEAGMVIAGVRATLE